MLSFFSKLKFYSVGRETRFNTNLTRVILFHKQLVID